MAYREEYVLAVRQGNTTLKEESGKVLVPFGDTYELRLKNKRGRDAIAFVYIDGRNVVKDGLVVRAHSHVDLERFVEDDLNGGKRFKFVPLDDHRVDDKGEPDNGLIEVKFHEVKECQLDFPWMDNYLRPWRWPYYKSMRGGCCGQSIGDATYGTASSRPIPMNLSANCSMGEAGATVEGAHSDQKFSTVNLDYDKDNFIEISVKIAGIKKGLGVGSFCSDCGTRASGKFCSSCGSKL